MNTYQLVYTVYGENQRYWPRKYIKIREILKSKSSLLFLLLNAGDDS